MKWHIRLLFTLAFIASWVTLISGWDEDKIALTILGVVCAIAYTILFALILIDLYLDTKDYLINTYHHHKSIQSRRQRYSLFRQKVKSEPVEFESEAREVVK